MTEQSLLVTKSNDHFFDQLPEDACLTVFEYLKGERGYLTLFIGHDKSIIATAQVCKNWRNDLVLRKERAEAATRLRAHNNLQNLNYDMQADGYPEELTRTFFIGTRPISRLPLLNLNRRKARDNLDFIEPQDMSQSVMRFQDQDGLLGVALKIQSKVQLAQPRKIVLAIFKHARCLQDQEWQFAWGPSDMTMENELLIQEHLQNGYISCRGSMHRINQRVLSRLLRGNDSDFQLPRNAHSAVSRRSIFVVVVGFLFMTSLFYRITAANKS